MYGYFLELHIIKGHCRGHFGQSAQIFYEEPGLNMNCSYNSEKKI